MPAKKRHKKPRQCFPFRFSRTFLLLIGGFLLVESIFLTYLAGCLSHLHLTSDSARRKVMRFFDPRWRRKQHNYDPAELKSPPFHHSQMARRRDYRYARHKLFQQQQRNQTVLDDFYTRPHTTQQVPFLVVGGSDGSGTRTFVQTLMDLGVTMIIDNYDTNDVHGEEMAFENHMFKHARNKLHGWPPLAQMILNETRSANYTLQNLSKETQQQAMEGLLFLKSFLIKKGQAQAKRNNNNPGHRPPASSVQYGFKAPITMVLLPVLQQVLGPIKFLHVVRDGRDVALSDNQSPVQKFYRAFYGNKRMGAVKGEAAMRLWNDWNAQVHQWARQREKKFGDEGVQSFDYMVMRTEDLLSEETRLEALVQLAEFVGARVTADELCCLSQKGVRDMGQSQERRGGPKDLLDALRGDAKWEDEKVKARYGKWRQELEGQPKMVEILQKTGAEALRMFGYEPSARFLDRLVDVQAFPCNEKISCSTL